jgi:hypothetical protein
MSPFQTGTVNYGRYNSTSCSLLEETISLEMACLTTIVTGKDIPPSIPITWRVVSPIRVHNTNGRLHYNIPAGSRYRLTHGISNTNFTIDDNQLLQLLKSTRRGLKHKPNPLVGRQALQDPLDNLKFSFGNS